ncbi:heparinase II/III domain-containing protein [Reyranella soli]|nr:heparinase II/III family protein [Reyranella soli]
MIAERRAPQTLRVGGLLGRNEMRALVRIADRAWLAISESKLDLEAVDLFMIRGNYTPIQIGRLPNHTGLHSAFTRTLCSKAARSGVFFSYDDPGLIDSNCRFVRWQVNFRDASPAHGHDKLVASSNVRSDAPPPVETTAVGTLPLPEEASKRLVPAGKTNPADKAWKRQGIAWLENYAGRKVSTDAARRVFESVSRNIYNTYVTEQMSALGQTQAGTRLASVLEGHIFVTKDNRKSIRLSDFQWGSPGPEDRNQLWVLQQWLPVRECLYERASANTFGATLMLVPWIRAWSDANLTPDSLASNRHLTWHDHATALRCIHLVYFLRLLLEAGRSLEEDFPRLLDFVGVHVSVLMSDDFYNRHNNHGFDQALALYLMACIFDLGELTDRARLVGRERLSEEIAVAFNEEGVHIENSPDYHAIMLARLVQAKKVFAAFGDKVESVDIENTIDKGLTFLAFAVRPDGRLPAFGDTEVKPLTFALNGIRESLGAKYLQYVLSAGNNGEEPPHLVRVFPKAGYAFIRERWGRGADFRTAIQVAVKCGFLSTFHRHDDDGAIVLHAFGEDWLIESGIFNYQEQNIYRRYLRSSLGHNIVSVLGVDASRRKPKSKIGGFVSWATDKGLTEVKLRSFMFPRYVSERQVRFDRSRRTLDLLDDVTGTTNERRNFQLRLHLPADKEICIQKERSVVVRGAHCGQSLRISLLTGNISEITLARAREAPDIAGWTSPSIGRLEEAWTLIYEAPDVHSFESHLRFEFEKTD